MTGKTKYNWDRNIPHHRIALTRFSVFAFVQSMFVNLLTILAMGFSSDGTREYVVITAVMGLVGQVVSFGLFFMMMSIMYNWVISEREIKENGREKPATVFYETKTGWVRGKRGVDNK